jgi:integrase
VWAWFEKMPVIKLSEAGVGRLEPPGEGRVDYWDKAQPGFGLRLTSSGKRTWQIMYRSGGVRRRLALGEWPALPLKLARQAAEQAMAQVEAGKDPARERAVVTGGPVTVQRLADAYLERHAKRNKKTWAADAGMIRREVLPAWGKRPADTIRRRDVIELVEAVAARGTGVMANRLLALIRKMFAWAQDADLVDANPARGVAAPHREATRERLLNEDEIAKLWSAWTEMGWPFGPLFKLLLLTGQPRSDIASMRLDDIQFTSRVWTPPGARAHGGRNHELPLSDFALELLAVLPRSKSGLVFPSGPRAATPVTGWSNAVAKARKLSGVEEWQLRDLRRTAAVGMARAGAAPELLDRVLNVRSGTSAGVRGIYQLAAEMDEKRRVLNAWAEQVRAMAGTQDGT